MLVRAIDPIHFEAGQALYDRRGWRHTYWYFLEWDLLQPVLNSHGDYYCYRDLRDIISFINVQGRIEEVGGDSWFYLTLNDNWSNTFEEMSRHCEECNRVFRIQRTGEIDGPIADGNGISIIRRIIEAGMRVENTLGLGIRIRIINPTVRDITDSRLMAESVLEVGQEYNTQVYQGGVIPSMETSSPIKNPPINKTEFLFLKNISPLSKRFLYDNKGKNPA